MLLPTENGIELELITALKDPLPEYILNTLIKLIQIFVQDDPSKYSLKTLKEKLMYKEPGKN